MDKLRLELAYDWEPFKVKDQALTFAQLCQMQLFRNECSHWGAAIYKWEGVLTQGARFGKVGILIDETDDMRQCIEQYARASPGSKEAYARDDFLLEGDIRLYIFRATNATLNVEDVQSPAPGSTDILDARRSLYEALLVMNKRKRRVLYQQLLVLGKAIQNRPHIWLVYPDF